MTMRPAEEPCDHPVRKTDIALPAAEVSLGQDQEWCVVEVDGEWQKIRFHDYDEIYRVPGLYEALFYDVLQCNSPEKIRQMLQRSLGEEGAAPGDLRVLDLGAGNGMVGEEMANLGVSRLVGIDILPEAAAAARRDRAGLYDEYFVVDMTEIPDVEARRFESFDLNCLTCVAALGFGDIPPEAFASAYNLIQRDGWVAFNIKSDFLESGDPCGFARLIRRMIDEGVLAIRNREQYEHRQATSGDPLLYTALVGVKQRDVPADWQL